jgi:hypothetical protein
VGKHVHPIVQREPEVLTPPPRRLDAASGHSRNEVGLTARVAPQRSLSGHLDVDDAASDDPPIETGTNGLDLRKLRH